MRGQPDQPALPETTDGADQQTRRSLPDHPTGSDQRRIDHRPRDPVTEDLRERLWRLPPGHPSSPYDGNGALRPPVPNLRAMELPLPGEEGYEESGLDSPDRPRFREQEPRVREQEGQRTLAGGQASRPETLDRDREPGAEESSPWRAALPALRDMWQKHQEKWPESERPPTDRSQDEPGSWRSDNGHYLNAEENLVSDHAKGRVCETEEKVTPTLCDIEDEVPDAQLVGLQHRLKEGDRFKEKISNELRAKPERSISQISENMPDALRYTFQFDADQYVNGYWAVHGALQERGYSLDLRRNSWEGTQYKGLNTRWWTSEGQLFEVQFHTPESFEAKQLTHEAYERIRSPATSDRERDELYAIQSETSSHVPLPDGALTIPDYRKD